MATPQRRKFKTIQDWHDFLLEIQKAKKEINPLDLRKACYKDIEKHRGKPLLVYATKFLGQLPPGIPNFIDLEDIDGFTDMVNSVAKDIDDNLQELLWESYILLNGFFNISPFVKLFETTNGVSWGKQVQQVLVNQPQKKK